MREPTLALPEGFGHLCLDTCLDVYICPSSICNLLPHGWLASIHVLHAMTEPLFNRKDLVHPSRHRRRRRPTKQKIWRFDGACGKTKAWKPRSDCLLQAGCCSGDQDLACSGLFLLLCTYTSISLRTWTNTRPPRKLERKFRAGWSQSPLFV